MIVRSWFLYCFRHKIIYGKSSLGRVWKRRQTKRQIPCPSCPAKVKASDSVSVVSSEGQSVRFRVRCVQRRSSGCHDISGCLISYLLNRFSSCCRPGTRTDAMIQTLVIKTVGMRECSVQCRDVVLRLSDLPLTWRLNIVPSQLLYKLHTVCYYLPARRIALAGNSRRIVSVCLAVCPSQPVLYQKGSS